jgi:hypothetical protein
MGYLQAAFLYFRLYGFNGGRHTLFPVFEEWQIIPRCTGV